MVRRVFIGEREFIIIGTAHVSAESVEEVRRTIEIEDDVDQVAIELCQGRYEKIISHNEQGNISLVQTIRKGELIALISNIFLASYQKKIGKELHVEPGSEMKAAIDEANKKNINLLMADRDINITLKRILRNISFREKILGAINLIRGIFSKEEEEISEELIENLKNEESLTGVMDALESYFPTVKKYLLDERDIYIAYKLLNSNVKKTIVVIGAAHLNGVHKYLENGDISDDKFNEIQIIPKKKRTVTYIGIGLLVLILVIMAIMTYKAPALGASNAVFWLIMTSSLATLGAIVARAHPITIIVSIVAGPVGAFLPIVSAGMISGIVETVIRKPSNKDFMALSEDVFLVRSWWKNPVLRVFLVFFFVSLGSGIGSIIGISSIFKSFFHM